MGAIGFTEFCEKGHIIRSLPDDYYVDLEDEMKPLVCVCGAKSVGEVTGWPDTGYSNYEIVVPERPLREEWVEVHTDQFNGLMKLDVYDVSKLLERNRRVLSQNIRADFLRDVERVRADLSLLLSAIDSGETQIVLLIEEVEKNAERLKQIAEQYRRIMTCVIF